MSETAKAETICIEAMKVYDFSFEEETLFLCFNVPGVSPGETVTDCSVDVRCWPVKCAPIATRPGFAEVTFRKEITIHVTVDQETYDSHPIALEKTIVLCVPADPRDPEKCDPRMILQCEASAVCEGAVVTAPDTVCLSVNMCQTFESKANVKLKVTSHGFCVPTQAEIVPGPKPPCPPGFPPQC